MGLSRPVAVQVWDGSTSTGQGTVAYLGLPVSKVSSLISNPSTKTATATLQGSMGHSTSWATLHSYDTSTGATILDTTTGSFVVDKIRLNVSANATTGVFKVWVAGA